MDRLKAMQVFVEVVDRGSLSAAAQRLDMSRAMVSRYLAELEAWVGVRLLHRTTRRLSLTPAGSETLPRCRRMLDLVGDMHEAVATPDAEPRGELRMTVSLSFGAAQLGGAVADFVARHREQIVIDAESASVRDPSVQQELNRLLDALNGHAAAVSQAQRSLRALAPA